MNNHIKNVGIIGVTGRMGQNLSEIISKNDKFNLGTCYTRNLTTIDKPRQYTNNLNEIFKNNDYVVDFSNFSMINEILHTALEFNKTIILCSTGWSTEDYVDILNKLKQKNKVFIAPNTSSAIYIFQKLINQATAMLNRSFDIDIYEKHHKHKIDIPSGTANSILQNIKKILTDNSETEFNSNNLSNGPRPKNHIGIHSTRASSIVGEHEVVFSSEQEILSIKHESLDRSVYAHGVIDIITWFEENNPPAGIYNMDSMLDSVFQNFIFDKKVK